MEKFAQGAAVSVKKNTEARRHGDGFWCCSSGSATGPGASSGGVSPPESTFRSAVAGHRFGFGTAVALPRPVADLNPKLRQAAALQRPGSAGIPAGEFAFGLRWLDTALDLE